MTHQRYGRTPTQEHDRSAVLWAEHVKSVKESDSLSERGVFRHMSMMCVMMFLPVISKSLAAIASEMEVISRRIR